ncbi:ABC transporter ATP-binding protein (plasmid) [Pseudorhodobacter turbinis]|uniref:ABC transporter ATP-binding protein n=1 Tax=Pseudorhodobacter turbinis TaxID=2500533 RepID=A0A4P8EL11_9RHOB|nr:ABC transporter ATP-binding protein [Pseudorhodobacter turbinis]QCO57727.1 ABC transporter ATP-binding protein [Pseudorhodobacter turbinis]
MAETILEVRNLHKSFGGVQAIRDLSFSVSAGEVMGLIGPNGSGKSTTVNSLAGLFSATSGQIVLGGEEIQHLPEYPRVAKGLTRTFQTASVFPEFTVREQVRLGSNTTLKSNPLASVFRLGGSSDEEKRVEARIEDILHLTDLHRIADKKVSTISSGEQRFLMIATALAADPKLILLDEPAAGLISHERKTLSELIKLIRSRGIAVLVIEHHMALIMEVCDRIVVLNFGSKIAEGTPTEIRSNKAVIDAYLGEAA